MVTKAAQQPPTSRVRPDQHIKTRRMHGLLATPAHADLARACMQADHVVAHDSPANPSDQANPAGADDGALHRVSNGDALR